MFIEDFQIVGMLSHERRSDRNRGDVVAARAVKVAVIPEEVGPVLERLGLQGSVPVIRRIGPHQTLAIGQRLVKKPAGASAGRLALS